MYKILWADKDTYITNRVVNNHNMTGSNVGCAGTLDLFKLYGMTYSGSTPNVELSRALIHFDLDPLRSLITQGKVDTTNSSFSCTLTLFDVYGGQPTPSNFTLAVHPLSQSFDEGIGRDIVYFGDQSVANFLTASFDSVAGYHPWFASGANQPGYAGQPSVDYITASAGTSLSFTQTFTDGDEDMAVDVTNAVKATLSSQIPDYGFRIALSSSLENDEMSYFVKRFASRHAYDASKHPCLIVKYDDSLMSDQANLRCDTVGTVFLYNTSMNRLVNLQVTGSALTGSNCVILNMRTPISGGYLTYQFSGSWRSTGVYSASIDIKSTNSWVRSMLAQTGSVLFDQIWTSVDGSIAFYTGSNLTVYPPSTSNDPFVYARYVASVTGLNSEHRESEVVRVRVSLADLNNQFVRMVKTPIVTPGLVIHDVHYSIRDAIRDTVVVPFDKTGNSTRLSSDSQGMFFDLDMSNLTQGRTYYIDLLVTGDVDQVIKEASPVFRISEVS